VIYCHYTAPQRAVRVAVPSVGRRIFAVWAALP